MMRGERSELRAARRKAKGPVDLSPFRMVKRRRLTIPAAWLGGTDKDDLQGACLASAEGASQIGFGPICEERVGERASWH